MLRLTAMPILLLLGLGASPVAAQRSFTPRMAVRLGPPAAIEFFGSATYWSPRFKWSVPSNPGPFDPVRRTTTCNGAIPTGLQASHGSFVHAIAIGCAALQNGRLTAANTAFGASTAYASGAGSHTAPAPSSTRHACPAGSMLIGIDIRSGSYIDAITALRCAALNADFRTLGAYTAVAVAVGGGAGSSMTLQCPLNQVVGAMSTTQGSYVDGLMIDCREFRPRQ